MTISLTRIGTMDPVACGLDNPGDYSVTISSIISSGLS
jgi:hypothetical protein